MKGRPDGTAAAHRRAAAGEPPFRAAVLTASDTRGPDDDPSGDLCAGLLAAAGVEIARRRWVLDERSALEAALRSALDAGCDLVVITGGTGPAPRDVTPEVVRAVCPRELPGFGELFRMLSYREVGAAAALSRATCAVRGRAVVYALPGSPGACRLALTELVLPELPHLRAQVTRPAGRPPTETERP